MEGHEERRGILRQLLGDTFVYGLSKVAGYLVGILLMPVYTHYLVPAEYGALENLFVFVTFLSPILALGLPSAVIRFWHLGDGPEGADRRRTLGSALATLLVVLTVAIPALLLAGPWLCRGWLGDVRALPAYRFAVATLPASALLALSLAVFRAKFRARSFGLCSVLQVVLLGGVNTWLVAGLGLGLTGVFLGGLVAGTSTALLALFLLRADLSLAVSRERLKAMLAYGLPLLPSAVAFWALAYIDRFLLTGMRGLTEVALYSAGAKIAGVLAFLNFAATTAFVPLALKVSGRDDAPRIYARALTGYTAVAAAGAIALSAVGREALAILSPPEYLPGHRVVPWLALGFVLAGAASIVNIGLHVVRRTHHITWVALSAAIANLLLNLLLIPRYGMVGAAVATAAAYGLMTGLYQVVTRRHYPVKWETQRLVALAGLGVAALAGIVLLDGPGPSRFLGRLGIAIGFALMLPVARILRVGEIRRLLTRG